jgi:hypothetical protein
MADVNDDGDEDEEHIPPATVELRVSIPNPFVVTESNFPDGSQSINVGSVGFQATSETGDDGHRQAFEGDRPQGEDDVLQVCRTLRAVLNANGGTWGRFEEPRGRVDDVDATSTDIAGNVLDVQVTRADQHMWGVAAANDGIGELDRDAVTMANGIRDAIDRKARGHAVAQRAKLVLALDTLRSPGHAHPNVAAAFIAAHGTWARDLGYRAIWLVGPTAPLSHLLA